MVLLKTASKQPKLYNTAEGRVLLIGIILSFLLIIFITYYGITEPVKVRTLIFVFFAHILGGRAAGIGLCIMNDLKFFTTLIYNFFIEIQILCITYSLFVLSITNYIKAEWIHRISNQMMHNADKYKDKIRKYGWLGLFLFVIAPLPATGPVMGSILGYMLKIGIWRNFSAVLAGTFFALLVWSISFEFLEKNLHMIQYVFGAIIIVVVFSNYKIIKNWFFSQD
ncbi:MAG: small multi-drug export protein [Desulfamplus sp.]|nr:small multi-drug export protein [Desulfamplus sp.]